MAPVLVAGAVLTALGVGTCLAALNVAYRDFRYVVPFLVQFWMFATPVVYPASLVPQEWQWALYLNPMAGVIEGFRSAFLGRPFDVLGNVGLAGGRSDIVRRRRHLFRESRASVCGHHMRES